MLPLWRLDLDTETLLKDDIAEWSNEEISAWLDWKDVQDQECDDSRGTGISTQ